MAVKVRDVLHVADLYQLLRLQIGAIETLAGNVYNVGGGPEQSVSLAELTEWCAARTGQRLDLASDPATRPADIPFFITDATRVKAATGWTPTRSIGLILDEVLQWLAAERAVLEPILG